MERSTKAVTVTAAIILNSAIEPQRSQSPQRRNQGFMASEYFTPQGNGYEKGIIPKLFSLRALCPLR
jgi:hypothetical protein